MSSSSSSSWRFSIAELPTVFDDVTPVDVGDDGAVDGVVAAIDYSEEFRTAYGYMRAILRRNNNERGSERALKLTATCLQLNPANYTVWHFRRLCWIEQQQQQNSTLVADDDDDNDDVKQSFVTAELQLAASLGGDNPKNYQVWYHRRAVLDAAISKALVNNKEEMGTAELEYISSVLAVDAKNYHAWSHRQWVVQTILAFSETVWNSELDYCDGLLKQDIRNNSAWNHRWFVTHRGGSNTEDTPVLSSQTAETEMEYAIAATMLDPYNESPWRYFVGILKEQILHLQDGAQVVQLLDSSLLKIESVVQNQQQQQQQQQDVLISETTTTTTPSTHLMTAQIDILEWKKDPDSLRQAVGLAERLANEYDPIRKKYWEYRIRELQQALDPPSSSTSS